MIGGQANRRSCSGPYVLIALVAFLVYANTLSHGLVYDDKIILESPLLAHPFDVKAVFSNGFYDKIKSDVALYRPLCDWSCVLNWRINEWFTGKGDSHAGFHLVNVLFHTAACCLAFAWLVEIGIQRWVGLASALLFAVHPIHVETVANVTGRSDAMAMMFGLAFLVLHRRERAVLAALAYLFALWSKESAIAFLPLAIATDVLVRPTGKRPAVGAWIALGITLAVWLALRATAMQHLGSPVPYIENPLFVAPFVGRLLTACSIQLDYLRLQLVPVGFSTDYSFNQIPLVKSALEPRFLGFIAVLVGATLLAWWSRKRRPEIALGVLGYAMLFSTTSNLAVPIGTIMAERLAYMPSIFVCLLVCTLVWIALDRFGTGWAALATGVIVALFGVGTLCQNRVWSDELTLFADQVRTAPNSAKAHFNYGVALALSRREREALGEYERSLAIYPEYAQTWYCKGNALYRLKGDPTSIIDAYRNAIRLGPAHADARANLALFLIAQGRKDEARPLLSELRALDPNHPSLPVIDKRLAAPDR